MRRVVITGMGAVTPVGNTVDQMWNSLQSNKCGIEPITYFDTKECEIKLAAEVKNFEAGHCLRSLEIKKMDRFSQFAVVASMEAYLDSGLHNEDFNHEMFSVFFGSGFGGGTISNEYYKIIETGYNAVSKMTIPSNLINMAAANIAIKLKAHGACVPVVTACASGTDCIGRAYREIKNGYSDIVLAGASEAAIIPVYIAGFHAIGALSKSTNPIRASIPFDNERDGFVMGEGAGSLVLEEYTHAKKRNAKIYAEIVGYGTTCDAYSLTAPDFTLIQGSRAMCYAINEAGIDSAKVSYINAHGTATKYNDEYETNIIKNVFAEYSANIAVSSTKSFMGHLLGAAGAVEAIITIKALNHSYIPPTLGYQVPDESCDLDYVINTGRKKKMEYAMSNSLGFGGHNSVLIFKLFESA
jgi:3-oxoacyl-[acyl-carrier-protein] synthase II